MLTLLLAACAYAGPAKILHQTTESVIVRMAADGDTVVWQEIGDKKSDNFLYVIDARNGKKTEIRAPKRPFGPAVAGGVALFGAGRIHEKIEVYLHDLASGESFLLHKLVPWIVEPAIQIRDSRIQAVWERSTDDDGNGLAVYLYEGNNRGQGNFRILADGPVHRKAEIPREYHRLVHNEYPEIDGDAVVFQNNEYGTPNIYRLDLATSVTSRLAPSQLHQERPAVSGPYTAWEESERGYAESNASDLYLHDARTGETKAINAEKGFHYQVRVRAPYVVYGAKREPAPNTPSIRVYDLNRGFEIPAQKCFPGAIFDYAPTDAGVYAAQRFGKTSSRLLFATWAQLEGGCK